MKSKLFSLVRRVEERDVIEKTEKTLSGLFFALLLLVVMLALFGMRSIFGYNEVWQFFAASMSLFVLTFGLYLSSREYYFKLRQLDKEVVKKFYER